jgi:putative membrane protein
MLTATGGLLGVMALVVFLGPLAPLLMPTVRMVFRPHYHWILWCVITFMLMAEWPKGGVRGQGGWAKFADAWKSTGAGLLTFLLAGILGFILFHRPPVDVRVAFQNLMPAFVGLFALPWLLLNMVSGVAIPPQRTADALRSDPWTLVRGTAAGALGGGFAAFFPGVTGGVGGTLAGHATAQTEERAFLVSQGASKAVYYIGAFLLFFVPGAGLTRGGAAWMLRGLCPAGGYHEYRMALGSVALAAAVAFLAAAPLARGTIRLVQTHDYRRLSAVALLLMVALVASVTGLMGLLVMAVATGIGLIPVLFGSRRMNGLAVILLPLACNLSGVGATVAGWLGLL